VWPGEPSTGAPGNGQRVLLIGDSLTRESRVATAKRLRASGWTPTFRCWGSRRLDWGIAQVRRAKELGQLPDVVVMALGTNDVSWEPLATTQARVRTLMRLIGPKRQVLWVNLDVDYSAYSASRALWFNDMIRREAATRDNLTVVPWRRIARAERAGRFDGIHYGSFGYRLRARTVAEAVDDLARRLAR
jgi:lysophospholipase L1-like esterase